MTANSFGSRAALEVAGEQYQIYRLDAAEGSQDLPFSLKVLLENLLRNEDGANITADHVHALAQWDPSKEPDTEIQFTPARVILQDLTGVPAVVDLAAMREAMQALGGDPTKINPLIPAELVIDHSVVADVFGSPDAFTRNVEIEFHRNRERFQFLRWGQEAFSQFKVVPPGTGIVHQVNIEYLARVVMTRDGTAYPDTCVGTDSHTTMQNGLGVLGWGVGGIEAEAAMLGQPISMLIPKVVGFRLTGELPSGATATDLVLTITELLRKHGVVGKFVEFHGEGVAAVPVANRATIGNMSPEFGSTCAIFPIDQNTLDYLRLTGRPAAQVELVEAYAKEQGLWHDPGRETRYSEEVSLDLSTVVPSIAGPKRPQDRITLADAKQAFRDALPNYVPEATLDNGLAGTFPASDPVSAGSGSRASNPVQVTLEDGTTTAVDHGSVVIAAITSCTNTSNPSVMVGAALLAKNAVDRGLARKPWVKTTLAPGSKVVMDYYDRAGLLPYLDKLGFNLVGYGCTTCIGNSGPLPPAISEAVNDNDLAVTAVLSGNRNFEGRINPDVKMNYLASPPLVVAYALAGTMDIDLQREPLGSDVQGKPVYLADIWPSPEEVADVVQHAVAEEMFTRDYADVFKGDDNWRGLDIPPGDTFAWDEASTYVRRPPYFARLGARRRAQRLQLLRLPPRQPRGDDPRHVRQHQAAQPACAGHRGRRHHQGRRAAVHLRCVPALHRRRYPAGRARRQGIRFGLVPRLGRQGHAAARRACGARRVLRAHPPVQPHRHGRAAAAVPAGGVGRLTGADRDGDLRHPRHRGNKFRTDTERGHGDGRGQGIPRCRPDRHSGRGGLLPARGHHAVRAPVAPVNNPMSAQQAEAPSQTWAVPAPSPCRGTWTVTAMNPVPRPKCPLGTLG